MSGSPFSSALEELRARRTLLATEVKRLTHLIHELEALPASVIGPYASVTPAAQELPSHISQSVLAPTEPPLVVFAKNELERMSYGQAAKVVLKKVRRPLSTIEMLNMLRAGGREVQGNDPYRTLYRTLMKHASFKNIDRKWTLVNLDEATEDLLMER